MKRQSESLIDWCPGVSVVGLYQNLHGKFSKIDQNAKLLYEPEKEIDEKVKPERGNKVSILIVLIRGAKLVL